MVLIGRRDVNDIRMLDALYWVECRFIDKRGIH